MPNEKKEEESGAPSRSTLEYKTNPCGLRTKNALFIIESKLSNLKPVNNRKKHKKNTYLIPRLYSLGFYYIFILLLRTRG